jgi:hypothetical protein
MRLSITLTFSPMMRLTSEAIVADKCSKKLTRSDRFLKYIFSYSTANDQRNGAKSGEAA